MISTLGTVGAGTGATVAGLKGGLGSASSLLESGTTIGALVAVNALGIRNRRKKQAFLGCAVRNRRRVRRAWPAASASCRCRRNRTKVQRSSARKANTTIGVIATDLILTKAQAKRLAIAAHDGFARAIWPSHTPFDGDLVFALATGTSGRTPEIAEFIDLCADCCLHHGACDRARRPRATPADNDPFPGLAIASLTVSIVR